MTLSNTQVHVVPGSTIYPLTIQGSPDYERPCLVPDGVVASVVDESPLTYVIKMDDGEEYRAFKRDTEAAPA